MDHGGIVWLSIRGWHLELLGCWLAGGVLNMLVINLQWLLDLTG